MSALRSQPLQPLNGGQLNVRSNNITPIKGARRTQEVKPEQRQQTKKKKEKLSALCKTLLPLLEPEMVEIIVVEIS